MASRFASRPASSSTSARPSPRSTTTSSARSRLNGPSWRKGELDADAGRTTLPPPVAAEGGGGGKGGGRGGGKGGGKGDRSAAARAAKAGATDASRHIEKRNICFYRNPAKNLTCSWGDDCRNEHLDTSVPEKLDRFNSARKRFDEVKLTSKKFTARE